METGTKKKQIKTIGYTGTIKKRPNEQERRGRKVSEEEKRLRVENALKGIERLVRVSEKYFEYLSRKCVTPIPNAGNTKKQSIPKSKKRGILQDRTLKGTNTLNDDDSEKPFIMVKDVTKQLKYLEGGTLRPYQIEGVAWLTMLHENSINGILADEMGVGKTVQVIGLICHLVERRIPGPFLVVAPLSTIPNWRSEFARFAPKIDVIVLQGSRDQRQEQIYNLTKYTRSKSTLGPVVLTSFQVPAIEVTTLEKYNWQYIVVDEGQRIKNSESQLASILRGLRSKNRLILTGTPLQNSITELWSLFNFLMPELFHNRETLTTLLQLEDIQDADKIIEAERSTHVISDLHRILKPFMLRRLKKDVLPDLVPKKELVIRCPMSELQHSLYSHIVQRTIKELLAGSKEEATDLDPDEPRPKRQCTLKERKSIVQEPEQELQQYVSRLTMQNLMVMLRKVVNHPYLVHFPLDMQRSKKGKRELLIDESLISQSGKLLVLDNMLPRLKARGHKVLLFSTFVMALDMIEEFLIMRGYNYTRLDGAVKMEKRQECIDNFNNDPEIFLFMISTRAGGLGLNLTGADTVIFFDRDWNPQVDLQAQDRCHRIGQTLPVVVYTLISKNTIDERILNLGGIKRRLEKLVIADGKFGNVRNYAKPTILSDCRALQDMLNSEESIVVVNTKEVGISEAEWEKLLDRSDLINEINTDKENVP